MEALAVPADRAILFDWGGTLMQTMPVYLGRGSGWSFVPPVSGATDAVRTVSNSWIVGLASNASESDEDEVRAALDTMGVGTLMERVYTFRRVGKPKPWPEFWRYVLDDLALPPSQVVMVGDAYMDDVWGAVNAGMHGIWLNMHSSENRTGSRQRTIHGFDQLPAALRDMGFA